MFWGVLLSFFFRPAASYIGGYPETVSFARGHRNQFPRPEIHAGPGESPRQAGRFRGAGDMGGADNVQLNVSKNNQFLYLEQKSRLHLN